MRRLYPDLYPSEAEPEEVPFHREETGPKGAPRNRAEVDRIPRGVLFRVEVGINRGFFDMDGYWCVRSGPGTHAEYKVSRGAPRKVMAALTKWQREELHRARLRARRHGLR